MTGSKILVVDDEPAIRDFVTAVLEDEGYQVVAAHTGRRAQELLPAERPDLVLMDVMMPGLDGRDVVAWIRAHPDLLAVPVILMSAAVRSGRADGPVAAFLHKPFDLDQLLDTVERVLAQHGAVRVE